jgi:outer membrane protein OmpA-like peptidoglycan-associated protein
VAVEIAAGPPAVPGPGEPAPQTAAAAEGDDEVATREGLAVVRKSSIVILQKIYFETNSAVIMEISYDVLDAAAQVLIDFPHIRHVHVAGHSDQRGPSARSTDLSLDRAEAVVAYLVSRGVEPARLSAGGYGAHCPIDPAQTPDAWSMNRRVDFTILETDSGCTGSSFACPGAVEAGLVRPDARKYLPDGGYCD